MAATACAGSSMRIKRVDGNTGKDVRMAVEQTMDHVQRARARRGVSEDARGQYFRRLFRKIGIERPEARGAQLLDRHGVFVARVGDRKTSRSPANTSFASAARLSSRSAFSKSPA